MLIFRRPSNRDLKGVFSDPIDSRFSRFGRRNGDTLIFGDQSYTVTHVGPIANQILQTIQHVTFIFDEVPEEQLTSAIYLEPFNLPTLEVGMKVIYK